MSGTTSLIISYFFIFIMACGFTLLFVKRNPYFFIAIFGGLLLAWLFGTQSVDNIRVDGEIIGEVKTRGHFADEKDLKVGNIYKVIFCERDKESIHSPQLNYCILQSDDDEGFPKYFLLSPKHFSIWPLPKTFFIKEKVESEIDTVKFIYEIIVV